MTSAEEVSQIVAEGAVPLHILARELPAARGRKRSVASLVRWAREGVKGLKLEAFHDGVRWFSSRPALSRFLAALSTAAGKRTPARKAGDEARIERLKAKALAELARM